MSEYGLLEAPQMMEFSFSKDINAFSRKNSIELLKPNRIELNDSFKANQRQKLELGDKTPTILQNRLEQNIIQSFSSNLTVNTHTEIPRKTLIEIKSDVSQSSVGLKSQSSTSKLRNDFNPSLPIIYPDFDTKQEDDSMKYMKELTVGLPGMRKSQFLDEKDLQNQQMKLSITPEQRRLFRSYSEQISNQINITGSKFTAKKTQEADELQASQLQQKEQPESPDEINKINRQHILTDLDKSSIDRFLKSNQDTDSYAHIKLRSITLNDANNSIKKQTEPKGSQNLKTLNTFMPDKLTKKDEAAQNDNEQYIQQQLYKNIGQVIEANQYFNTNNTFLESIYQTIQEESALPLKLRSIHIQNKDVSNTQGSAPGQDTLNLSGYYLNDKYSKIAQIALQHSKTKLVVKSVNANFTGLNDKTTPSLINSLPSNVYGLNLSKNKFTDKTNQSLMYLVEQKNFFNLTELNLSRNQLSLNSFVRLINKITVHQMLKKLNLSHSQIDDRIAEYITQLLVENDCLEELYLNWNSLSSLSGSHIAEGLEKNNQLRVLDLSYNNLGVDSHHIKCGVEIMTAIHNSQCKLVHLDLSFNKFTLKESLEIETILKQNQKLMGFHFQGNEGGAIVDTRGFLQFPDQTENPDYLISTGISYLKKPIQGVKRIYHNGQNFQYNRYVDCCWVCEGWVEHEFKIKIPQEEADYVFLHLNFERFRPFIMYQVHAQDFEDDDLSGDEGTVSISQTMVESQSISSPLKNQNDDPKTPVSKTNLEIIQQVPKSGASIRKSKSKRLDGVPSMASSPQKRKGSTIQSNVPVNSLAHKDQKYKLQELRKRYTDEKYAIFQVSRMCPPNYTVQYFYTIPRMGQILTEKSGPLNTAQSNFESIPKESVTFKELSEKKMKLDQQNQDLALSFTYNDGTTVQFNMLEQFNEIQTEKEREGPVTEDDYYITIDVKPRKPEPIYQFGTDKIEEKAQWGIPISLTFKEYTIQNQAFYNDCFQFDWSCSQIPRLIQDVMDQTALKIVLRRIYPQLQDSYQMISALGVVGEVFSVPVNTFTEFFIDTGLVDGRLLKLADLDFNFIATQTSISKERNALNPERALVRYNFMEILVRLAADRYIKTGQVNSFNQAFSLMLNDGLYNKLKKEENPQIWRDQRFWNQECDNVIKANADFLRDTYNQYAGSKMNDQKGYVAIKRLSLSELKELILRYNLFDANFVERDAAVVFALSMMPQIDELNSDRHLTMYFAEFCQVLGRIAEQISLQQLEFEGIDNNAPSKELDDILSFQNYDNQDSYEGRAKWPLFIKLSNLFYYLQNSHRKIKQKNNQQGNTASFDSDKQDSEGEDSMVVDLSSNQSQAQIAKGRIALAKKRTSTLESIHQFNEQIKQQG